jgi:hypothetical protein
MKNIYALLFVFSFYYLKTNAQVSVTMQHNDLKRTGWNMRETALMQTNVNSSSFGKIFSRNVDDQIYAQPLVLSNLPYHDKLINVVFVATVNNSVYAFNADDDTANTPLWHVNLTYPSYRAIKNTDMTGACGGAYQDFSGNMGIVGTPAIDTVNKVLYVVARSVSKTGTPIFVQYLHAIDIKTGQEKPGSPVYITATVDGTGDGSVNGKITFDQQKQNQRPGLLLYNGVVYIAWASHCDWTPYHGWVMGYDAKTLLLKYTYIATPTGGLAGIWMSGQAPAVDDQGFIYLSTGNGTVGANNNPNDTTNRGESILKLSTASGNLKVVTFFTPKDYKHLELLDLDYGVDGVLLLPKTNLSISGSKESYLYLTDNNNMGGYTADNSSALEVIDINPKNKNSSHIHGSPVYFMNAQKKEYIYVWCAEGLLSQIPFIRSAKRFDTANTIRNPGILPSGMPGAMLALTSNSLKKRTGILWASHPLSGDANHKTVPGILQAFAADDVTHELWNSNQNPDRDSVGKFAKFVCPTIANGKVYLATFSNQLVAYGLLSQSINTNTIAGTRTQAAEKNNFDIYPNPAKDHIILKYNSNNAQQIKISLTNGFGAQVYQSIQNITKGNNAITLNFSSVNAGTYLLNITDEKGNTGSKKLVIEK